MNQQTHILELPKATVRADLSEYPSCIDVKINIKTRGQYPEVELFFWLSSLFKKYNDDRRPVCIRNSAGNVLKVFSHNKRSKWEST